VSTALDGRGIVIAGHGVASGVSGDPRFPEGTLSLQLPIFAELGAEVTAFHPGTINVQTETVLLLPTPHHLFRGVKWHPAAPQEDFSLFEIELKHEGSLLQAMIYLPHSETKPEHHQPADVIEILAPPVAGLGYGSAVTWRYKPR
jgi:hypothetical protein